MSQFRAFFAGFRTALAALIVCALMTGGALSPAAAHPGGHAAKSTVDCHNKLKPAAKSAGSEAPANEDLSGHCPECCLSASFVDLMMPARAPAPVRARATRVEAVFAHLVASDGRESLISGGGNGARAPPVAR